MSAVELFESFDQDELDLIRQSLRLGEKDALTPEIIERAVTPVYIGPTWGRDEDGSWLLPKKTLGWQIAAWCNKYLLNPNDGTKPWMFTPEQLRFVLWWYALDDEGQWLYRTGVLQRRKGWGKDPLLAAMCLVEMCGPSRFSHWADGEPAGKSERAALVQVTAVSREQTGNTSDMFPLLMSEKFKSTYGVKPGIEIIRASSGRQQIQMVTSSYRSIEGKRATFTLLNEVHHWIQAVDGHKLWETIDGNATKLNNRYLAITNAYLPGEDSVGERMRNDYEAIAAGNAEDAKILYDSVEAHATAPLGGPLAPIIIENMIGDSTWTRVDSVLASIRKSSISPARSRRMWYNQVLADEDSLVAPSDWESLKDEGLILKPGDAIVMGLDGGKSDDSTALVAIRPKDMATFVLGMWEKPTGPSGDGWELDAKLVDLAVDAAFGRYRVEGFYSDVQFFESWIVKWQEAYESKLIAKASEKHPIGLDMRGNQHRLTMAHEQMLQAIFDGELVHDGDIRLARHVYNARRRENRYGVSFGKESRESKKKVDGYAAMLLAHMAAIDVRLKPRRGKVKTGRGFFI